MGFASTWRTENRGVKGSMKAADRSGAAIALVLGERELEEGVVVVKQLATGEQETVALDQVVDKLGELVEH